jgi:transposase
MGDFLVNVPMTEQSCSRSEALVGPERRRRWSDVEKRRIVAESLSPGAVSRVVARRHGIHPSQLCDWRRELRRLAAQADKMIPDFVPISVVEALPEASPSGTMPDGQIEIVMGMATVRVPNLVDEPTLRRVLSAVRSL